MMSAGRRGRSPNVLPTLTSKFPLGESPLRSYHSSTLLVHHNTHADDVTLSSFLAALMVPFAHIMLVQMFLLHGNILVGKYILSCRAQSDPENGKTIFFRSLIHIDPVLFVLLCVEHA
jgi:hypothetical protein